MWQLDLGRLIEMARKQQNAEHSANEGETSSLVPKGHEKDVELRTYGTRGSTSARGDEVSLESPKESKGTSAGSPDKNSPTNKATAPVIPVTLIAAPKNPVNGVVPVRLVAAPKSEETPVKAKSAFCFKPVNHHCHDTVYISLAVAAACFAIAGIVLAGLGFKEEKNMQAFIGSGFVGASILLAVASHIYKSAHNEAKLDAKLQESLLPAAAPV